METYYSSIFKLKLGTTSISGGAIEIIEIDGYPICIRGDFNIIYSKNSPSSTGGR